MATGDVFVVNPIGFNRAFRSWEGPVGQDMTKRVIKGTALAIASAPAPGKAPRNRTGINYATGRLIASIRPGYERWGFELEGRVTANARHSNMVHGGTRPHIIRPRKAGGRLVFFWAKAGRTVVLKQVNHPGTQGIPFLSEHLRAMAR